MKMFKKNVMEECKSKILKIPCLLLLMLMLGLELQAQRLQVKGIILDSNGESVIGASIVLKGNTAVGTISDLNGNFTLSVPNENASKRPILTYPIGKAPLGSFPLKVFKNRT